MKVNEKWVVDTSKQFPDVTTGNGHQGCQTVWDVDNDGVSEILFTTRRKSVERPSDLEKTFDNVSPDLARTWCYDANGRFKWFYPPSLDEESLPGDATSKVSLVDVDDDGEYELCFTGRGGRLHVLKGDSKVLWTWDNPHMWLCKSCLYGKKHRCLWPGRLFWPVWFTEEEASGGICPNNNCGDPCVKFPPHMHGAPQAFDVDGDGFVEFFINDSAGFIRCIDHDGKLLWNSFLSDAQNHAQPTIADIDGDGEYEVLWTTRTGILYCMKAADGEKEWEFNTGPQISKRVPEPEHGAFHLWKKYDLGNGRDYTISWTNTPTNQVIVADVNKDGDYEILVWNDAGKVFCIGYSGNPIWIWGENDNAGMIRACQAIGDVDEDGSMEMVINAQNGLFLVDIGGNRPFIKWKIDQGKLDEWLPGKGAMSGCDYASYQLIIDIDGDGDLEIVWFTPFPIIIDGKTGDIKAYYFNNDIEVGKRSENGGWWGDVDKDGVSELICELNDNTGPKTKLYCLTMNGAYPAKACWPEYYHSAMPVWEQYNQGLSIISAYSNSLWFPIGIDLVIALVKDLHLNQATLSSLLSLLNNAKCKNQEDETKGAQDQLTAFQHQITQIGNEIPAEQADTLKTEVQKIIDSL
jgi:outer membrane protein assembly factor BamB